ncbi:MAG TPA: prepilin peptidase [Terriglobales bacterium]|nr:prepilin peptidase [Terriglobales bacterium]
MTDLPPFFYATAIFLFGLAFGSFLNVCIHRLPLGLSVVRPRSACPQCHAPIGARDNIPVVSWLVLGGRCRNCKAPISPRYVFVELLTGLLFLACWLTFGPTFWTLKFCVFSFLLLGLIFTDAETKLLPDALTLPGLVLGVLFSLLAPVDGLAARLMPWLGVHSHDLPWRLLSLGDALLGAAVGASFIYGAGAIYLRARGIEGMGFGDVKLMALVGAFLGVKLTVFTLFSASLVGSLAGLSTILMVWIKRTQRRMERNHESLPTARRRAWKSASMVYRHYEMPFGVFLGTMAMVAVFFGDALIRWYVETYL